VSAARYQGERELIREAKRVAAYRASVAAENARDTAIRQANAQIAASQAAAREADRSVWDRAVGVLSSVVTAQVGDSKCSSLAGLAYLGFSGGVNCQYNQFQYYDADPRGTLGDIGSMLKGEAKGAIHFIGGLSPIPDAINTVKCIAGGWSGMQECVADKRAEITQLWDSAKDYYVRSQHVNQLVLQVFTGDASVGDVWDEGYQLVRDYTFGSTLDASRAGDYDKCGQGASATILTVGSIVVPGVEGVGLSSAGLRNTTVATNASRATHTVVVSAGRATEIEGAAGVAHLDRVAGPARSTDLVLGSFRALGKGRNAHVRTVGSVDELRETFNAWSVGAELLAPRGPKITDVYRLPDGGIIQWRTSSASGGPSIDIFPVNGRQRTVHLIDGVQG